jgi:hypothetical protein
MNGRLGPGPEFELKHYPIAVVSLTCVHCVTRYRPTMQSSGVPNSVASVGFPRRFVPRRPVNANVRRPSDRRAILPPEVL